jgi:hypothetical protein
MPHAMYSLAIRYREGDPEIHLEANQEQAIVFMQVSKHVFQLAISYTHLDRPSYWKTCVRCALLANMYYNIR